jgi:hypothetical protein
MLRKHDAGKTMKDVDFMLARSQHFSQELYETRIASLQRFVAMTVMFHQMGKRVQEFFARISFGVLGYRMDRTQSIMRIATTASPISGSDIQQRMRHLQLLKKVNHSINVISAAYLTYKAKKGSMRVSAFPTSSLLFTNSTTESKEDDAIAIPGIDDTALNRLQIDLQRDASITHPVEKVPMPKAS